MADTQEKQALEISRLHSDEVNDLFALFAALQELDKAKEHMAQRLKTIPGGTRDMAMIRKVLSNLVSKIVQTIPPEKRLSLSRNMQNMSYKVYFVHPVNGTGPDEVIVNENDLRTLLETAHDWNCIVCEKDCNRCDLGRALDHTMIQCRGRNERWSDIDMHSEYTDRKAGGKL